MCQLLRHAVRHVFLRGTGRCHKGRGAGAELSDARARAAGDAWKLASRGRGLEAAQDMGDGSRVRAGLSAMAPSAEPGTPPLSPACPPAVGCVSRGRKEVVRLARRQARPLVFTGQHGTGTGQSGRRLQAAGGAGGRGARPGGLLEQSGNFRSFRGASLICLVPGTKLAGSGPGRVLCSEPDGAAWKRWAVVGRRTPRSQGRGRLGNNTQASSNGDPQRGEGSALPSLKHSQGVSGHGGGGWGLVRGWALGL